MKKINEIRRLAGLGVKWEQETEISEKDQSLSKDMHPITNRQTRMFYLVHNGTPRSEALDVISQVDGNSFANIFIGAGIGVPAKEQWILYPEHQKQQAIKDANARLEAAQSEYRVTEDVESILLVLTEEDENATIKDPDESVVRALSQTVRHLEDQSKKEDDLDVKDVHHKDHERYIRLLAHVKKQNPDSAKKAFRLLDTAARELLSDPSIVKKKNDRKACAKYFGYSLVSEGEDTLEEGDDQVLSRAAHEVLNGTSVSDVAKKYKLENEELEGEVNLVKDHLRSGKYEKVYGKKPSEKLLKYVKESTGTYDDKANPSHEDSHERPVNVAKSDTKNTKDFPKVDPMFKDKEDMVWKDGTKTDKDESPAQLHSLDTPSPQDQSGGGDMERKVKVPSSILQSLKTEIDQARKEAKLLDVSNKDASTFYERLANAMEDLSNHIKGGTVYDIKKAQAFMQTLMGPILHKIPANVVKFLAHGGQPRSLKSYITDVSKDYPIVGPRNALK